MCFHPSFFAVVPLVQMDFYLTYVSLVDASAPLPSHHLQVVFQSEASSIGLSMLLTQLLSPRKSDCVQWVGVGLGGSTHW